MTDFLTMAMQSLGVIYTILAFGLTLAVYVAFRYQIDFWWLNVWYSLPFIGKLARLSKDTTRSSNPGWLRAEETLCGDYRRHILTTSESEFRKRLAYMSKAQDLGRKPLPGWMVGVLAVLLVAEGLGFSYLLGTWMAREGSANVHTLLMLAIVFVICTVMLFLTHAAGHQLYRTGLIRRGDREWRNTGQEGELRSAAMKLDDDQSADDRAPLFKQTANRVGTDGGYAMVWVTAAAVIAIASLSTWMRISHLNQEIIQQTVVQTGGVAGSNPFAVAEVPAELARPQQEADMKARAAALSNERSEGLAAFIMLALIFVITQIVGIYAGFRFGFAGKESAQAFNGTLGLSTYDDYLARFEPMIQVSQAKLQTLQRNLAALGSNVKLSLHKTFDDYIREAEGRRLARRHGHGVAGLPDVRPEVWPVSGTDRQAAPGSLADVLQRLDQLDSPADKRALIASLADPLFSEAVSHLKAESTRQQQLKRQTAEADLKDLF